MSGFLGEGLSSGVRSQLEVRRKILGDGTRSSTTTALLNSGTAWVALYSGVEHTGNSISPKTAQNFKLEGGLAFQNDQYPGLPVGYWAETATGIRPRAGIVDATVKSKGTYGTLREADINIKAWTVEDFNTLYDLYMRPGFSFLLEWGHSVYSTDGTGIDNAKKSAASTFLSAGATYNSVMEVIKNNRKNSGYNYDAVLGVCKNFSWSLNEQGGYDITISLISKGEVIESIGAAFDPGKGLVPKAEIEKGSKDKSERKSAIHYFLKRVEKLNKTGKVTLEEFAGETPTFAALLDSKKFDVFSKTGFDIEQADSMFDKSSVLIYISLRTLCHVIQEATVLKEGTAKDQFAFKINSEKKHPHATTGYQFSIDPYICVQANKLTSLYVNGERLGDMNVAGSVNTAELVKQVSDLDRDVLGIYVSNLYLFEVLDPLFDAPDAQDNPPNLLDLFESILGGVNEALGGINELQMHYDEEENEWAIVDRKYQAPASNLPVINLTGIGSSILSLKTESKITNKLASMISIAATAEGGNTKTNVDELLAWNRGDKDRIAPIKKDNGNGKETTAAEATETLAEWATRVQEAFQSFNGGVFIDQQYDPDAFKALQSGHQQYQSNFLAKLNRSGGIPPGIIPVELSFTMHGIAGFKIAQAFKIQTPLIPVVYTGDNMGYLITKCDHSIQDNNWTTEIGAMMYNIKPANLKGGTVGDVSNLVGTGNPNAASGNGGGGDTGTNSTALQDQAALGKNVSYDRVKAAVLKKGYKWYGNEMEINVVGVRNVNGQQATTGGVKHPITNKFNDILILAWIENGVRNAEAYPATTVPGAGFTKSNNRKFNAGDLNPNGTGTMREQQHLAHWYVSTYKGNPAMRPTRNVPAHRDNNYTDEWMLLLESPAKKTPGLFQDGAGMLIHNSGNYGDAKTKEVNNWSAGCQVLANFAQTNRLVALCEKSVKATKQKALPYSLIKSTEITL